MAKQELTMLDLSYIFKDMETQKDNNDYTRRNRFTGESIEEEFTRYQIVKQAEKHADPNDGGDPMWDVVRDGLDWFRKNNAKAYMVLLD
jgi:hypothetical protein